MVVTKRPWNIVLSVVSGTLAYCGVGILNGHFSIRNYIIFAVSLVAVMLAFEWLSASFFRRKDLSAQSS